MKNLKTYLMILLAFCMVVTIAACGGSGDGDGTTAAPSANDTTVPQGVEETTTAPQGGEETTTPEVVETTTPEEVETTTPEVVETTTPEVVETTTPEVVETTTPEETLPDGDPVKDPWADDMGEGEWTKAPEVTEAPAEA